MSKYNVSLQVTGFFEDLPEFEANSKDEAIEKAKGYIHSNLVCYDPQFGGFDMEVISVLESDEDE